MTSHNRTPGVPARGRRRATAAVELAFLMTFILVPLLLSLWDVGRLMEVHQVLDNASREAGRQASTGLHTYADVNTTVTNYLNRAGVTQLTNLQLQVYDVTTSNHGPHTHGTGIDDFDPSTANQMDILQVTVSVPANNMRWIVLSKLFGPTNLTAQTTWYSMKDVPVNVSPTLPVE